MQDHTLQGPCLGFHVLPPLEELGVDVCRVLNCGFRFIKRLIPRCKQSLFVAIWYLKST